MPASPIPSTTKKYALETDEFALSDTGLHWLRSRYNYKTISYQDLDEFRLTRGREVNNWWLLFGFGIALLILSALVAFIVYHDLTDNPYVTRVNIEMILALVIPLLLGGFSLYTSLRNGEMLYVYQGQKRYRFPLRKLVEGGQRDNLIRYLKAHSSVRGKLKVDH